MSAVPVPAPPADSAAPAAPPPPQVPPSHLSLGVIGHVDHGKTSLVKALSGIDTDRLAEEKRRGMSIVLGFAHLDLDGGIVDLIDVPGHEQFVRTMVAGATGIDAALLAVDVREGAMPQTVEHLAIAGLIGVRHGVIAVTKADLADAAERTQALRRLRAVLRGTCLELAPAVFVSAQTGEGLQELRDCLRRLLRDAARRPASAGGRGFHLPVDRVFSLPGRGTIVTGTLRGGAIAVGDAVEVQPRGLRTTVRQLEFHNRPVDRALPGQRVGVNLRHLKPQEIGRGDVLGAAGLLKATTLLDADLRLLPDAGRALVHNQPVRLLFGATDVAARVRLLSGESDRADGPGDVIRPGGSGIVQLHTGRPVAAAAGEAFILRAESPPATIGGGRFLDAAPARHRRRDAAVLERLRVLARGGGDAVLAVRLKAAGYAGVPLAALCADLDRDETGIVNSAAGVAVIHDGVALYRPFLEALGDMLVAALDKHHRQWPMRRGAPLAACRAALPRTVGDGLFRFALRTLCEARRVEVRDGVAWLFGHDPMAALGPAERELAATIESGFRDGGVKPPDVDGYLADERRAALFHLLVEQKRLILLPGQLAGQRIAFHAEAVQAALAQLQAAYPAPQQFTVSDARALLGSTRKFTVPLLEHLDAAGRTRRRGDHRSVAR